MKPETRREQARSIKPRRQMLRWLLIALWLCVPSIAQGQVLVGGDASFEQATAELARARGPAVYPALRSIWRTWDGTHPDRIEAALRLAQRSAQLSPAARSYARTLEAYARVRRGDLHQAESSIKALGFIDRWLFVGPFDNEGKSGYDQAFDPERELGKPIVQGRVFDGKEHTIRWRELPNVFRYGWVDVGSVARPEKGICAYAASFIRQTDAKRSRPISIWVGSGGAFKLFWNGRQVLADTAYRGHDVDRFAAQVTLEPGNNSLLIKVCGDDSAPVFSVRVADASGAPDSKLEASSRFEDSINVVAAVPSEVRKPARNAALGAIQQFEALLNGAQPDPIVLENYARYLVLTQGDDTALHKARDLAKRAADLSPTVRRLLLAGQLAEDRNQRALWIDKAADRLKSEPTSAGSVRLAQAELARESVNWRDALPYYEQVLAADPDNIEAIRGKVELYNEADLKRSAFSVLKAASERNPYSLTLLNMLSSQARAVGYLPEATEAAARYAAFRFDDRSYISSRIDLSLARRAQSSTEHWLQRLLALEPSETWAYAASAQAYRALGQSERALGAFNSAHDLAPDDVGVLQALSDIHGELGHRDEQRNLLGQILQLRPQAKDVREYIEHIEPEKPRPDEAMAWQPNQFLRKRALASAGHNRRTLLDLSITTVFGNGLSSSFRQVVFQPLTDSAAALARQYAFSYEAGRQRVQLRGARVFRGDGRIDEAIESGEAAANDPSIAMYTSARTFYVQFPRLDPGDVVELRYRIDDVIAQNEFADYFGEVVQFQSGEPIDHAEYVLIAPKSRKMFIDHRGIPGLKTERSDSSDSLTYRFYADAIPALVPEPNMPPWSEVLGFVHVSTFDSYAALGRWYWGLSREQLDLDDETRKLAHSIVEGKTTNLDKVKAIYNWVVKNTRYVALEFGIYGFKPRRCVQTVARGWGDCKDKATVIVSLLKDLGIDATLVVLRTGLRGNFKSSIASLAPFDHAIAYVPSLDLYLDGTAEHTGATELPAMDLGALGVQINQGNAKLVRLPANDPSSNVRTRHINATLNADGSAALTLNYETRGTGAAEWRRRYHANATFKERVSQDLAGEFTGFQLISAKSQDLDNFEKPVVVNIQGTAPQFARKEGTTLSIAVTPQVRLTPNYASLSRRQLALRIPAFSTVDNTYTVRHPKGMRLLQAPAAIESKSEFGSFSVQVSERSGEIVVKSRLSVNVDTIEPAQYAAWQEFCRQVDSAFSPRLLIGLP